MKSLMIFLGVFWLTLLYGQSPIQIEIPLVDSKTFKLKSRPENLELNPFQSFGFYKKDIAGEQDSLFFYPGPSYADSLGIYKIKLSSTDLSRPIRWFESDNYYNYYLRLILTGPVSDNKKICSVGASRERGFDAERLVKTIYKELLRQGFLPYETKTSEEEENHWFIDLYFCNKDYAAAWILNQVECILFIAKENELINYIFSHINGQSFRADCEGRATTLVAEKKLDLPLKRQATGQDTVYTICIFNNMRNETMGIELGEHKLGVIFGSSLFFRLEWPQKANIGLKLEFVQTLLQLAIQFGIC